LAGKPRDWLNPRKKRLWLVVAILFYTLGGFFLAPWIAERQLVSIVGDLSLCAQRRGQRVFCH